MLCTIQGARRRGEHPAGFVVDDAEEQEEVAVAVAGVDRRHRRRGQQRPLQEGQAAAALGQRGGAGEALSAARRTAVPAG
jgi:hypothetical protein